MSFSLSAVVKSAVFIPKRLAYLTMFLLAFPMPGLGHPVSFAGGTMPTLEFDGGLYAAHLTHSLSTQNAVALHYVTAESSAEERFHNAGFSFNRLFKRWLFEDSQANIYGWAGPMAQETGGGTRPGGLLGMQADWESRRLYAAMEGQSMLVSAGSNYSYGKLRAGVAPYLADFDGIHTFLIAQAHYRDLGSDEGWEFSPVVRIFYSSLLAEVGVSDRGNISGLVMAQLFF